MRNHTATHLLQSALREVLGSHVQQQGSLVAEDRLRFDFSHPKAISKEEIKRIEDRVNENVAAGIPVQKEVLGIEEAKEKGALAFLLRSTAIRSASFPLVMFQRNFVAGRI